MAASEHCPTCGKICHGGECYNCGWVSPSKLGGGSRSGQKPPKKQKQKNLPFWPVMIGIVLFIIWLNS